MNTQQKKYLAIATVVGLHAVVITLMLAQHGCKSGSSKTTAPSALAPVSAAAPLPGPVADDDQGFSSPTTPPPELVRPAPLAIAPEPAPTQVAQFTEQLSPVMTPGPAAATPPISVVYEVGPNESLYSIARKNGVTVNEILSANPKITNSTILQPKMHLVIPTHAAAATTAVAAAGDERTYKVANGDSLIKIAQNNHTTVKALQDLNSLGSSTTIRAGQTLKIPAPAAPAGTSGTAGSAAAPADTAGGDYYTVVSGDTLGKIANKFHVSLKDMYASTGLNDTTAKGIKPGTKLKLPANASGASAPAPAASSDSSSTPATILSPASSGPVRVSGVPASGGTSAPVPVAPINP